MFSSHILVEFLKYLKQKIIWGNRTNVPFFPSFYFLFLDNDKFQIWNFRSFCDKNKFLNFRDKRV